MYLRLAIPEYNLWTQNNVLALLVCDYWCYWLLNDLDEAYCVIDSFYVDTGIANEKDWGISLLNESVNESGTNEDGSTWYRESGDDLGDNGYRCRWTRMGGQSHDGSSEWRETVKFTFRWHFGVEILSSGVEAKFILSLVYNFEVASLCTYWSWNLTLCY